MDYVQYYVLGLDNISIQECAYHVFSDLWWYVAYLISMHLIKNSFTWNIHVNSYFFLPQMRKNIILTISYNIVAKYIQNVLEKARKSQENTVVTNWIWLLDRFIQVLNWFIK